MEEGAGAESSPREPGAAGGSAERQAEGHAPPDGLNAMEKARWRIQHGAPGGEDGGGGALPHLAMVGQRYMASSPGLGFWSRDW